MVLINDLFLDLLDRGWRRSGSFLYKPEMEKTCCPSYTIRLKAGDFVPSKEQLRVSRRLQRYSCIPFFVVFIGSNFISCSWGKIFYYKVLDFGFFRTYVIFYYQVSALGGYARVFNFLALPSHFQVVKKLIILLNLLLMLRTDYSLRLDF